MPNPNVPDHHCGRKAIRINEKRPKAVVLQIKIQVSLDLFGVSWPSRNFRRAYSNDAMFLENKRRARAAAFCDVRQKVAGCEAVGGAVVGEASIQNWK